MLTIKIGNEKYPIESFNVFITQNGQTGVRITGDTPQANGFEIYDEDTLVADGKDYTYLYREDGNVKEYTKEAEEIIPTQSFATGDIPDSAFDVLSRRISAVNSRVTQITPYEQTKTAYFGEIEKVFYGVPDGVLNVTFDKYDGEYSISRIEDRVTVSFPRLTEQTNISLMVQ